VSIETLQTQNANGKKYFGQANDAMLSLSNDL